MNNQNPSCSLEEALCAVESLGATPAAFARVAYGTGWSASKLEAAYYRAYQSWAASRGYDL